MTLGDIISSIQTSLQNVGNNLQGGKFPSPFVPKVDPQETKRIEMLNKRAKGVSKLRDLKQQHNDSIQSFIEKGNFVPQEEANTIRINGNQPQPRQPAPVYEQVLGAQAQPQRSRTDELLEGFGNYGATPSARAVDSMAQAEQDYPVFRDNPNLLAAISILETGAGQNMTRPKNTINPQNLMNWGVYTDFIPNSQAHSVERAASGIGEREPYYQDFRDTGNLEDFVNTYAPPSDGNQGYLQNLLKVMENFE